MADRALIGASDAGYRIHRACTRAHAPAACACTAYCTRSDVHRAHTALAGTKHRWASISLARHPFCPHGRLHGAPHALHASESAAASGWPHVRRAGRLASGAQFESNTATASAVSAQDGHCLPF